MRTLIVLVVGLMAVGCGQRNLTLEEQKIVGTYEIKKYGKDMYRIILLDNGIMEEYENGKKDKELKWSIVGKEIHIEYRNSNVEVLKINDDGSLTGIAYLEDGKRTITRQREQDTWKKVK